MSLLQQRLVELTPSWSVVRPHEKWIRGLVALKDGSFVSCSDDKTAKRWIVIDSPNNRTVELAGTYVGHSDFVMCGAEKVTNVSFVTGSADKCLKEWDTATGRCLKTIRMSHEIWCLLRTRNESSIICGLYGGWVEIRRASDLSLVSSLHIHTNIVKDVCELEDGTFLSGSYDKTLKRWDETGKVLQSLSGHTQPIWRVMELKSDIAVSASMDYTAMVWRISTAEHLRTLTIHNAYVYGVENLPSRNKFVTGSWDKSLRVWDSVTENCIEVIQLQQRVQATITLRDGSIVIANNDLLEIRRT